MSNSVFSQIPAQVLSKISHSKFRNRDIQPKKRVKFYEDEEVDKIKNEPEIVLETSSDIDVVELEDNSTNEPTSSNQQDQWNIKEEEPRKEKKSRDAILQTEQSTCRTIATQTNESLLTRPLAMTQDELHRMNMQSFAPIMSIPRLRKGNEPPLKIGLTLRGRKRKVLYPDDDDYVPPEVCNAKGA